MSRFVCILALGLFLSSCASIVTSDGNPASKDGAGIPYYLPSAALVIDVKAGFLKETPPDADTTSYTLSFLDAQVRKAEPIADVSKPYYLHYDANAFADDHVCIVRTTAGLLQAVKIVSSDRTSDILVRAAETVALVATGTGAPFGPGFMPEAADDREVVWEEKPFVTLLVDPSSKGSVDFAQSTLRSAINAHVKLLKASAPDNKKYAAAALVADEKAPLLRFEVEGKEASNGKNGDDPHPPGLGIYTRTAVQQNVRVEPVSLGGPVRTALVHMPDKTQTSLIELTRSFGVSKSYDVRLNGGIVTSFDVNKPSEALAVASLPLEIAGAIIETPARFFTAIGRSFSSETAAISAKAELIKAEAELERLKREGEGTPTGGNAASENGVSLGSARSSPKKFGSNLSCLGSKQQS